MPRHFAEEGKRLLTMYILDGPGRSGAGAYGVVVCEQPLWRVDVDAVVQE